MYKYIIYIIYVKHVRSMRKISFQALLSCDCAVLLCVSYVGCYKVQYCQYIVFIGLWIMCVSFNKEFNF